MANTKLISLFTKIKNQKINSDPVITKSIELGSDLVQVSRHNTVCEKCQKYEGKIFSITGLDNRFPILDDVPPFCEGCKHNIYAVFVEALEIDGTLQKFIEFSNDRIQNHPFDKYFIPIKSRPKIDLQDEIKIRKNIQAVNKKVATRMNKISTLNEKSKMYSTINNELLELKKDKMRLENELSKNVSWFKVRPDIAKGYKDLSNSELKIEN